MENRPLNTSEAQWLSEQLNEARERILQLENQLAQRRLDQTKASAPPRPPGPSSPPQPQPSPQPTPPPPPPGTEPGTP